MHETVKVELCPILVIKNVLKFMIEMCVCICFRYLVKKKCKKNKIVNQKTSSFINTETTFQS